MVAYENNFSDPKPDDSRGSLLYLQTGVSNAKN